MEWEAIASTVIVISIILSGIAIGVGRAFSISRLERFGVEELAQAVINAAILGFAISLSVLVVEIGNEYSPAAYLNLSCENNTPPELVLCSFGYVEEKTNTLLENVVKIEAILGYYQTLSLDFENFTIQPLYYLKGPVWELEQGLSMVLVAMFFTAVNKSILEFFASSWFGVVFGGGLIFRSFFFSRRFGSFLIALSIGFFIFYPLVLMLSTPPIESLDGVINSSNEFLNNTAYSTIPIVELNDNYGVGEKLYNLTFKGGENSSVDMVSDITSIVGMVWSVGSELFFHSVVFPFFSAILTFILIKEFAYSFSGEGFRGVLEL